MRDPQDMDTREMFPTLRPTVPTDKLKQVGRHRSACPINQGDIFNPDKISQGNLPQDQEEIEL